MSDDTNHTHTQTDTQSQTPDDANAATEELVPVLAAGDLRMIGYRLPAPVADLPDDQYIAFPRSDAVALCRLVLRNWALPESEADALLTDASIALLSELLVSHLMLRVLFEDKDLRDGWVHLPNKAFEERKPIDLIQTGELQRVKQYLTHQVFNAGW